MGNMFEFEFEENDEHENMLREDEDLLRKILGKRFNLPKRENFMDFIKDAQEYLENDWYKAFCKQRFKNPNDLDVSFIVTDYEVYENAVMFANGELTRGEYEQQLLHYIIQEDGSDIEFLRLLDVMGYFDETLDNIRHIDDLLNLSD